MARHRKNDELDDENQLNRELDQAAAELRVVVDRRLGRTTPDRVVRLAADSSSEPSSGSRIHAERRLFPQW